MSLNLAPLKAAVAQLEDALTLCNQEPYKINPRLGRHMRTTAIKSFEYTYALSFNLIVRCMEKLDADEGKVSQMAFSNIIRDAFGRDLVRSDVHVWREYRRKRGITSHTYDEEKARLILASLPDFLQEARYVLARLEEMNQSLDPSD